MKIWIILLLVFVTYTVAKRDITQAPERRKTNFKSEPRSLNSEKFHSKKYVIPEERFTATPKDLEYSNYLTELDNFRPQDENVTRIPYTQNLEFWENGGPIYIHVSGGGFRYEIQWLQTGLMYDIAEEESGALIMFNLRYFALHRPTITATMNNLQYLTVEQILVDIAYLVTTVKENLDSPESPVILWGSGFGGTLAAYARQKYPNLIDGVWSSSGVFLPSAYTNEPYAHLSDIIERYGGEECAQNVEEAFETMENLIFTDVGQLAQDMNMCWELRYYLDDEIAFFFEEQIKYITDYFNLYHDEGLAQLCHDMTLAETPYQSWVDWVRYVFGPNCRDFGFYEWFYFFLNWPYWDDPATDSGLRQWYYLTCTQLGLGRTTGYVPTLFTPQIQQFFHMHKCEEVFYAEGYNYTQLYEATENLIIEYGSVTPRVSHVIYTNGEFDQWYPHGIHEVDVDNSYVFNIPLHAQSADLLSIHATDSEELLEVKERIIEIIKEWSSVEDPLKK